MNLLNLKYFTDIVELGSISKAARRNYIAQQSMSNHLKKLEDYYQTVLITRGNPLSLTSHGRRLYQTAKQVLSLLDQVQAEISASRSAPSNRLVLGFSLSGIPPFLEGVLDQVRQKAGADLELQLLNDCADLSQLPDEAALYLGLEPPEGEFAEFPLLSDRVVVAVSRRLLEEIHGAGAEEAAKAVQRHSDPAGLNPVPFIRIKMKKPEFLEGLYHGIQTTVLETSNDALGVSLCRDGKGALITTEDYARRVFQQDVHILVIPLPAQETIQLSLYCRKGRELSPAAALFLQTARDVLASGACSAGSISAAEPATKNSLDKYSEM